MVKDQARSDPAFRTEWDALEPKRCVVAALLRLCAEANLSQKDLAARRLKPGLRLALGVFPAAGEKPYIPDLATLVTYAAACGCELGLVFGHLPEIALSLAWFSCDRAPKIQCQLLDLFLNDRSAAFGKARMVHLAFDPDPKVAEAARRRFSSQDVELCLRQRARCRRGDPQRQGVDASDEASLPGLEGTPPNLPEPHSHATPSRREVAGSAW